MDLDWITLYDYMSIFSRAQFKTKVNKFYESFYPLKLKNIGRRPLQINSIERVGILGIMATYIHKMLFALRVYLEAEYFLSKDNMQQQIKLSKIFIKIEQQYIETSLRLEQTVYIISEVYKKYTDKQEDNLHDKSFLEVKLICSINRIFQFIYSLYATKDHLNPKGFEKLFETLHEFTFTACQKAMPHIKLFPEIGEILCEILHFFTTPQKEPFNFHSHLMEESKNTKKRCYPLRVKKLFTMIPNKQKTLFVNLNDQNFCEYLTKIGIPIPKELIENYFRSEEEINSIVAEEENFIESIMVSEKHRGKIQWKKKAVEQLVNLSVEKQEKQTGTYQSKLHASKEFKLSKDYPLYLF